jgi:hypothetical protein
MGLWGELRSGETMTCVHCGTSWILKKGSGKVRGFCQECNGYHCGAPNCCYCVPLERRLENIEAGLPELTPAPVKIFVPPGIDTVS